MSDIAAQPRWRRPGLWLDVFERTWISVLFLSLALRLLRSEEGFHPAHLLLLVSEGLLLVFVIFRRPAQTLSQRPADWALAFGATSGPLLVTAGGEAIAPAALCAVLMMAGTLFQLSAKLTLRRSFGLVAANRGIKVGGPYRLVRHPMYAGYLVTHIGFLLLHPTFWNAAVYAASFGLQVVRLLAEERLLAEDPRYVAFQQGVRYRLLPGVF
jgi:protein-S-isoprenylcysteine O-methyltransferase Ste14